MVVSSWKDEAACSNDMDERWLGSDITVSMARLCWACPVRADCLFEALRREEASDPGIWGGTNEYDRRAIRKDRNRLREVWAELEEAAA
jgi:hypothetical protein